MLLLSELQIFRQTHTSNRTSHSQPTTACMPAVLPSSPPSFCPPRLYRGLYCHRHHHLHICWRGGTPGDCRAATCAIWGARVWGGCYHRAGQPSMRTSNAMCGIWHLWYHPHCPCCHTQPASTQDGQNQSGSHLTAPCSTGTCTTKPRHAHETRPPNQDSCTRPGLVHQAGCVTASPSSPRVTVGTAGTT